MTWQNAEHEMKAAMRAAKAGDTRALVEYNRRIASKRVLTPIDAAPTGGVDFDEPRS
jgi:hypothetical protein